MGLQSDKHNYPKFKWLDPMTPALSLSGSYKHWGLFMPANEFEPYAFSPPEYCAGGNFTETYQSVSGWADTSCDDIHIYICQIRRERTGGAGDMRRSAHVPDRAQASVGVARHCQSEQLAHPCSTPATPALSPPTPHLQRPPSASTRSATPAAAPPTPTAQYC